MPGHVKNCLEYDNDENCIVCDEGYVFINLINDTQYCLQVPDSYNCFGFNDDSINTNNVLICETCIEGFEVTSEPEDLVHSACLNIEYVEHCVEYDNQLILTQSTLECVKCEENYFMKENECILRSSGTSACVKYSPHFDFCTECNEGFYLKNDKTCQSYPTGIHGCIEYSDQVTCTRCRNKMFLKGNTCNRIKDDDKVKNCAYYQAPNVCSKCNMNYFLTEDRICVEARA